MVKPPEGTVTIMFTDIAGSTALRDSFVAQKGEICGDEEYRRHVLNLHNKKIRPLLNRHNGFEVETNGDSFMAAFSRPADAVSCSAEIQNAFQSNPIPTDKGNLSVRIGIHTGQPMLFRSGAGWDYDGHAVTVASRIEALLKGGGQILCSENTRAVAGHLPGIRYHSCGRYDLKGVTSAPQVFEILWHDAQTPAPPVQPRDGIPYPWLTEWVGRREKWRSLLGCFVAGSWSRSLDRVA